MKNAHELGRRYQEAMSTEDVGELTDIVQEIMREALQTENMIHGCKIVVRPNEVEESDDELANLLINLFEAPLPDLMVFVPATYQTRKEEWDDNEWFRIFHIRSCQTHGMHCEEVLPPFGVFPGEVRESINPNLN